MSRMGTKGSQDRRMILKLVAKRDVETRWAIVTGEMG